MRRRYSYRPAIDSTMLLQTYVKAYLVGLNAYGHDPEQLEQVAKLVPGTHVLSDNYHGERWVPSIIVTAKCMPRGTFAKLSAYARRDEDGRGRPFGRNGVLLRAPAGTKREGLIKSCEAALRRWEGCEELTAYDVTPSQPRAQQVSLITFTKSTKAYRITYLVSLIQEELEKY